MDIEADSNGPSLISKFRFSAVAQHECFMYVAGG